MRALRNACALAGLVVLSACAESEAPEAGGQESDLVTGIPDARQIAAKLTRAVSLTSSPGGGDTYCTLPAGSVTVARFESGHYRIYLPERQPCDPAKPDSFRGWVTGDALAIEDTAYFGKLKRVESGPLLDVKMSYAGSEIFCTDGSCLIHEPLYGQNRCYLHPRAESRIRDAAERLQRKLPGAKLTLHDCYRPVYVQLRMAEIVPDPTWVALPAPPRYGGHNGGIAIDVGVLDKTGAPLDMGSGFDEFTERSHFDAPGLSRQQTANRQLLRDVMTGAGLKPYDAEWWHFSVDTQVEPLDLAL